MFLLLKEFFLNFFRPDRLLRLILAGRPLLLFRGPRLAVIALIAATMPSAQRDRSTSSANTGCAACSRVRSAPAIRLTAQGAAWSNPHHNWR